MPLNVAISVFDLEATLTLTDVGHVPQNHLGGANVDRRRVKGTVMQDVCPGDNELLVDGVFTQERVAVGHARGRSGAQIPITEIHGDRRLRQSGKSRGSIRRIPLSKGDIAIAIDEIALPRVVGARIEPMAHGEFDSRRENGRVDRTRYRTIVEEIKVWGHAITQVDLGHRTRKHRGDGVGI